MKKKYPCSKNAKAPCAFHKHLEGDDKRRVNKSTRKLGKLEIDRENKQHLINKAIDECCGPEL